MQDIFRADVTTDDIQPVYAERRWWRWLIVGLADIGGSIVKPYYTVFGSKVASRVANGASLSAIAASIFCSSYSISLDDVLSEEYTESSLSTSDTASESDGYYHNRILKEVWNKYGDGILSMTHSEIIDIVSDQTELHFGADCLADFRAHKSAYLDQANQLLNILQQYDEYDPAIITDIQVLMPEQKQQWDVVQAYVEGLADVKDTRECSCYLDSTLKLIDDCVIPAESKEELVSAVSVGTASYNLWSIDEINSDEE